MNGCLVVPNIYLCLAGAVDGVCASLLTMWHHKIDDWPWLSLDGCAMSFSKLIISDHVWLNAKPASLLKFL
jgi:hypothetical protein